MHSRIMFSVMVLFLFVSCVQQEQTVVHTPSRAALKKMQEKKDIENLIAQYFKGMPEAGRKDPVALAKKINAFVHSYCTCEPPLETNIDNLIRDCRTSCGGYVHVFRKIAGHYGLQTRAVFLFNIPLQGNHAMVEVLYGDKKWALFDPTFGTFFTPAGRVSEIPYSLDDLYFSCSAKTLRRNVVQARSINPKEVTLPLDSLYSPRTFHARSMKLSTYLQADDYGYPAPYQYSLLWMDIDMKNNVFRFGGPAKTIEEGDAMVLSITNKLLLDKIPGNRISYNMSFLGQMGEHTYKNGYRFSKLKAGAIYRMTIYGINPAGARLYPHFSDSRAVLQRNGIQDIPTDVFEYSFLFRARDAKADLILETYQEPSKFIRIFGIRVDVDKTR